MDTNVQEVWKEIKGYENKFEASNQGRIRKIANGRILSQNKCKNGYMKCDLCVGGEIKHAHKVHRLVALAFIPNPDNLPQINHINCIKDDNRPENLEWCNNSMNQIHAYANGLNKPRTGKDHAWSKEVLDVETGIYYDSAKEAYNAHNYPIAYGTFAHSINGKKDNHLKRFIYV